MTIKKMLLSSEEMQVVGQVTLTSSQTWVVPNDVFSISVLGVEPGQNGTNGAGQSNAGSGGPGGLGGNARYLNNIAVTPGQTISVSIGSGTFNFGGMLSGAAGGVYLGRAGTGGNGATGGAVGGAGGGSGGSGISISTPTKLTPGLGGIKGSGLGPTTAGGAGGAGLFPGGGGGGGGGSGSDGTAAPGPGGAGGEGGGGCVRIIWPGVQRSFPGTRTADEIPGEISWGLIDNPLGSILGTPAALVTDGAGIWLMLRPSTSATTDFFLSTDNGKTFSVKSFGVASQGNLICAAFCDGVFIVGTQSGTILRSTDGCQTWSVVTVLSGNQVRTITYNTGVLILGLGKTIMRSLDKGLTFSTPSFPSVAGFTQYSASGNGVFIVSDSSGNPLRSTDLGLTFTAMQSSTFARGGIDLRPSFGDGSFVAFSGGSNGTAIYISNADASVFTDRALPIVIGATIQKISRTAKRSIVSGGRSRFFEMKDGAASWVDPPAITNNLADQSLIVSTIEHDGYGVSLVAGSYGLMMRGELK